MSAVVPLKQETYTIGVKGDSPIRLMTEELRPIELPNLDGREALNIAYLTVVFAVGVVLLSVESALSTTLTAEILLSAGLPATFLYARWLFLGRGTRRSYDLVRVLVPLSILMLPGLIIASGTHISLFNVFGRSMVSAAVLVAVEKFFFLKKDEEKELSEVKQRLKIALNSPGAGMAFSYYYNFLKPISELITTSAQDNEDGAIYVRNLGAEKVSLASPFLFVIIPEALDGRDIKVALRDAIAQNKVHRGAPGEQARLFRQLDLFFLEHDPPSQTCDLMFDIPTIVSSCWDRHDDLNAHEDNETNVPRYLSEHVQSLFKCLDAKDDKRRYPNITEELHDFANMLFRLCSNNQTIRDLVKIVLVRDGIPSFDLVLAEQLRVVALPMASPEGSESEAESEAINEEEEKVAFEQGLGDDGQGNFYDG